MKDWMAEQREALASQIATGFAQAERGDLTDSKGSGQAVASTPRGAAKDARMSAPFQLTPQAIEDLDGIWWFIAEDSHEAADRVEREIIATCHRRRDITPLPVRFWTLPRYRNYVIVYRPETKPLQRFNAGVYNSPTHHVPDIRL